MEPFESKVKIYLGDFTVVDTGPGRLTINVGKNVHITIYLGDFPHDIKSGQTLPLFTEIPYANLRPTSVQ